MTTNRPTTRANLIPFPFPTHRNAINDDYEIFREELGVGISGKVLRCQHRQTRQICALKILQDSNKARREVINHKKACENCPYIVQLLDIYKNQYQSRRCLLLVMELMEGGELFDRIKQQETSFTERDAAKYIWMIVQAVDHLHQMDMAHRDLKPENLLLTSDRNDAILKLSDFGFSKEGNNEPQPLSTPLYTPYYVAPEILSNTRYDKACDIWSMGVVMYILLCGYPPFYPEDNRPITSRMRNQIRAGEYQFPDAEWKSISNEAKSTIQRMLTVDPTQRITIGEIRTCSWLTSLTSERAIDMSSIRDSEIREQVEVAVASANEIQRRPDDDSDIELAGPEASRIAKRAAKKKAHIVRTDEISLTKQEKSESNEDEKSPDIQ